MYSLDIDFYVKNTDNISYFFHQREEMQAKKSAWKARVNENKR